VGALLSQAFGGLGAPRDARRRASRPRGEHALLASGAAGARTWSGRRGQAGPPPGWAEKWGARHTPVQCPLFFNFF